MSFTGLTPNIVGSIETKDVDKCVDILSKANHLRFESLVLYIFDDQVTSATIRFHVWRNNYNQNVDHLGFAISGKNLLKFTNWSYCLHFIFYFTMLLNIQFTARMTAGKKETCYTITVACAWIYVYKFML